MNTEDAIHAAAARVLDVLNVEVVPLLVAARAEDGDDWTLPHVGDFVLVMCMEDGANDLTSVIELGTKAPRYRKIGLLTQAIMDWQAVLDREQDE